MAAPAAVSAAAPRPPPIVAAVGLAILLTGRAWLPLWLLRMLLRFLVLLLVLSIHCEVNWLIGQGLHQCERGTAQQSQYQVSAAVAVQAAAAAAPSGPPSAAATFPAPHLAGSHRPVPPAGVVNHQQRRGNQKSGYRQRPQGPGREWMAATAGRYSRWLDCMQHGYHPALQVMK